MIIFLISSSLLQVQFSKHAANKFVLDRDH